MHASERSVIWLASFHFSFYIGWDPSSTSTTNCYLTQKS